MIPFWTNLDRLLNLRELIHLLLDLSPEVQLVATLVLGVIARSILRSLAGFKKTQNLVDTIFALRVANFGASSRPV
jgi:hypothetical protein